MSESKMKRYRRLLTRETHSQYRNYIYHYVERLCREPLKVKLSYMWMILRKINPHTGERYE